MNIVLIELILWTGLLFLFWALKDGLNKTESDIDMLGRRHGRASMRYWRPQQVAELIGSYRGEQIYRYAVIDGQTYQFDHVCPAETEMPIDANERCVAPGLVYRECEAPAC